MTPLHETTLWSLLDNSIGTLRTIRLCEALAVHPDVLRPLAPTVHRSELAQVLLMRLFEAVIREVPNAAAYVRDTVRDGRKITLDHGALRTVATDCGRLPGGHRGFARILEPLGFGFRRLYPLDRLRMTGRSYTHRDLPAGIGQFFVSELHPERFSTEFQQAVERVVGNSRDPLTPTAEAMLDRLDADGELPRADAQLLLPNLLTCFARQHDEPQWSDYLRLREESAEMAWIATEGNTFNHAADRVADVPATAARQRALGRPIKDVVEVSSSGRVIQTAFRAAMVARHFVADDGLRTELVPGSFHEFISRAEAAPGEIDLDFDTMNAQGIFGMTAPPAATVTTLPRDAS